jgi:hypothetical protein
VGGPCRSTPPRPAALLAFQSEETSARDAAGHLDEVHRSAHRSIAGALQQQLGSVGSSGYAIDMGEHMEDVRAVAVRSATTPDVVGALAIVGRLSTQANARQGLRAFVVGRDATSGHLGFDSGKREASQQHPPPATPGLPQPHPALTVRGHRCSESPF